MAVKFSEMIATRTDLALSLEAGFDDYQADIAEGYGAMLAPWLEEGETPLDVRFQLQLLRRGVERHRQTLESLDKGLLAQAQEDERIRDEANQRRDAVDAKLRLVRHVCRGFFGTKTLGRIGIQGDFPRGASRLYSQGLTVQASLENPDIGLPPLLELDFGNAEGGGTAAQLAAQLEPGLTDLGELLARRHAARRKTVRLRLQRQETIRNFDDGIRGIVRMAQGMSRLAGRTDLGSRFRPILQRVIRKLQEEGTETETETQEETAPADTVPADTQPERAGDVPPPGPVVEPAPTHEAAASAPTSA